MNFRRAAAVEDRAAPGGEGREVFEQEVSMLFSFLEVDSSSEVERSSDVLLFR